MNYYKDISNNDLEDEINISKIFKIFKKYYKFIFGFTSFFTISSITYTYIVKPVYRGTFEIVVEKSNSKSSNNNFFEDQLNILDFSLGGENSLKSQEFILKSPSVLMPVYDFVKENKKQNGEDVSEMDFKIWRQNNLETGFEKGTNILSIGYKDQSKQFILKVLELISEKYKSYSKNNREKELTKFINYLEEQEVIFAKKAKSSQKSLNFFSIENGLGDIDGFVDLGNNSKKLVNFNNIEITNNPEIKQKLIEELGNNNNARDSKAAQRYQKQFNLLERYEAEYLNLSSKLKPNSKTLTNLKIKIDNLKSSLKRPNKILLEFRELSDQAARDQNTLTNIQDKLVSKRLEKVKQLEPWIMISKPTIDKFRVSPKRKEITIASFLISLISSMILVLINIRIKKKIYGIENFKKNLNCKYLDTLTTDDNFLNQKLLDKIISENSIKGEFSLLILNNDLNLTVHDYKYIDEVNEKEINSQNKIIIITQDGFFNLNQINRINKFIKIYEDKFIGWFYIE